MKNKPFRYLWVGQVFANYGDIFYVVGLIALIYSITGSAFYMSLLPFTTSFFRFISSLISPIIIDRFKLKQILAHSQGWKTTLLVLLAVYLFIFDEPSVYAVLLFIACISLLDGVAAPVSGSLTPILVKKEELIKANGLLNVTNQIIFVSGWPLGAILLALMDSNWIVWMTVILYMLSAICVLLMKVPELMDDVHSPRSNKWESIKSGWVAIARTPPIRLLVTVDFLVSIAGGVWVAAILYVYVDQNLHRGEQWWGYINTSYFLGMILGGILAIRFAEQIEKHIRPTVLMCIGSIGALTLLFGFTSVPVMALLLSALYGLPDQIREITYTRLIQENASEKTLTKVYAAMGVVMNLTFAVSALLLGYITEQYGVKTTFVFAAGLVFLAFLYAFIKREDIKGREQLEN